MRKASLVGFAGLAAAVAACEGGVRGPSDPVEPVEPVPEPIGAPGVSLYQAAPASTPPTPSPPRRFPTKWIPVGGYFQNYGDAAGTSPCPMDHDQLLNAAKWDVLYLVSPEFEPCFREPGMAEQNGWLHLKGMNPETRILTYRASAGGFYGTQGELESSVYPGGIAALIEDHGPDTADPWMCTGRNFGGHLRGYVEDGYENTYCMDPGRAGWRQYWIEHGAFFGQGIAVAEGVIDLEGTDGHFYDNFYLATAGWTDYRHVGDTSFKDCSAYYPYPDSCVVGLSEPFQPYLDDVLSILDGLHAAHPAMVNIVNDYVLKSPWMWDALEQMERPPAYVFDECDSTCSYGAAFIGNYYHPDESDVGWLDITIRNMQGRGSVVPVLFNNSYFLGLESFTECSDIEAVAERDEQLGRCYDLLWYDMAYFMMGFDTATANAVFSFNVAQNNLPYWQDEFDPAFLHLGDAVGPMQHPDGDEAILVREFEDGWMIMNAGTVSGLDFPPFDLTTRTVTVPEGTGHVVDHTSFRSWNPVTHTCDDDACPPVESFDLPFLRAAIVVKDGRDLTNGDNT